MSQQIRDQLQATLGSAYTLERELGGGGMSRVFVAEETALRRKVVVKVLPPELTAGVNVERFNREILLAAKLQHPHIVPVLTAGETHGLPYYTMPLVEGESLRARLARGGALGITEVVGLLRDVARALAYAHERGIVHRDIKPDNVLITGGSATVTDFGIAKAISASRTQGAGETLTQVGTSIGTPTYMSPEQAAGDPDTDHRADLYSFGCMAYELLAGRPPFVESAPRRLLAAHMGEKPRPVTEFRADTPPMLAELVMRCLAKEADDRPQSAGDLVRVLETVTSSGGSTAMPSVLLGGPGMFKKALAIYAVAFVAVAILAKAAIVGIGLPDWVFPGSLVVMALGLPVILWTGYVQRVARRAMTQTPTYTPGGTSALQHGTMVTMALKAAPHVSWYKTARGGMYAFGVFIVMIGAFMAMRQFGIGPFGSLVATGALRGAERVLVTDFTVSNADSSLGRVLGDATKTTLASSNAITLATPEEIASALRRMQESPSATLHFERARTLALRNNIRIIVDGQVTGLGPAGFIVTLKLVTADSVRELASFRESANDAAGLISTIDKLSRRLRERMGESLRSVHATLPLFDATTASLDALRKYTEGSRYSELENDNPRAIALLREAVKIDSTFAAAWRKLGIVLGNSGAPRSSIDSALAKAYAFRGRLSEGEQHFVVAAYYSNGPGRDRAKSVAAYDALARLGAPNENNLALRLMTRREYARAESLYREQERRWPGSFVLLYGNLTNALLRQGKFDAADSLNRAQQRARPTDRSITQRLMSTLYLRGDTGKYRRTLDSVVVGADTIMQRFARGRLGALALRDGRISEWRRGLVQGRPDSSAATPRQRYDWATNAEDVFVRTTLLGRQKEVEKGLDAALAGFSLRSLPEPDRRYLAAAITYAQAGKPDKARAVLAQRTAEIRDTALLREEAPLAANGLGEILLAEGKPLDAIREFRKGDVMPDGPSNGCDICLSMNLSRAFDAAGQVDSAIVHYERFIVQYSSDRLTFDQRMLAAGSRRLGELYEAKGDIARAVKFYRDFVTLWQNADAELQPQVAAVRDRLRKLTPVERPR